AEELAAAFDRAGVPWRERRGRPALAAAPVRLALALLDLVEEDFPREPLIELLCSRLPPHALARVLRQAHVRDDASEGGEAAARTLEQDCAGLARAAGQLGEARLTRAEFAQVLSEALAEASLAPGGARGGAVQLVELRELAGRSFEHLFAVGLVDGELPARP